MIIIIKNKNKIKKNNNNGILFVIVSVIYRVSQEEANVFP